MKAERYDSTVVHSILHVFWKFYKSLLRNADLEKIKKCIFHFYTTFSQFTKHLKSNFESWLKVTLRVNQDPTLVAYIKKECSVNEQNTG